jgi:glycosyltransferase involved in cell wall biosynthesis
MKLSAVIITKNEEDIIADCIDSVSFCDEVILVDSSDDNTPEIAKKMGAHVYTLENKNFAERRNAGLEKARGEWILYVDADERVTPELKKEILTIAENGSAISAYRILRKNFYLGKNEWPYIEKLERLFKKDNLEKWYGKLHESPMVKGRISELSGYLLHYTHQKLGEMVDKTNTWSETEALLRFDSHHPSMTWWRFPRVMLSAFFNSYITQKGFKAGTTGLVESMYQAFSIFITYAKLWEMQEKARKHSLISMPTDKNQDES